MRVAVILPARNEAPALGQVLAELPRSRIHEIIVVDNGSTDETAAVAKAAGARVISVIKPGYGRACLAGLAALDPTVEVVAFLDADHSDYPEELPQLIDPILHGQADLVIGSRSVQAQAGSLTLQQRLGNALACSLIRKIFGYKYTDLGPFRAIRRTALKRLAMEDQGFGWTVEMQAKAARDKLRILERPVRYRPRIGRSKISGTFRGSLRAATAILWMIWKVARSRPAENFMHRRRVLVFLKHPEPGKVKTRLAASVGQEAASTLYRACVELTLERLSDFQSDAVLCVDPPEALWRVREWVGPGWTLRSQQGKDLGERLEEAATQAFALGAQRVVILGTDSPWVRAENIANAFDTLDRVDVAIGPTEDGGYYLIGLSRCVPELFRGIAWSSADVFHRTLQIAKQLGLRTEILKPGYDIDRWDDVRRFVDEERRIGSRSPALETMTHIAQERGA